MEHICIYCTHVFLDASVLNFPRIFGHAPKFERILTCRVVRALWHSPHHSCPFVRLPVLFIALLFRVIVAIVSNNISTFDCVPDVCVAHRTPTTYFVHFIFLFNFFNFFFFGSVQNHLQNCAERTK